MAFCSILQQIFVDVESRWSAERWCSEHWSSSGWSVDMHSSGRQVFFCHFNETVSRRTIKLFTATMQHLLEQWLIGVEKSCKMPSVGTFEILCSEKTTESKIHWPHWLEVQRVLNNLWRHRLSRHYMLWLLTHPLLPLANCSFFSLHVWGRRGEDDRKPNTLAPLVTR